MLDLQKFVYSYNAVINASDIMCVRMFVDMYMEMINI